MKKGFLYHFESYKYLIYSIRVIEIIICIILFINIDSNPGGFSILIGLLTFLIFLSSVQEFYIYSDSFIIKSKRLIQFLSNSIEIPYTDIEKIEYLKKRNSILFLFLPGIQSYKLAEFHFYLKNGMEKKMVVRGRNESIERFLDLISDKVPEVTINRY